jgi:hypothetical protein
MRQPRYRELFMTLGRLVVPYTLLFLGGCAAVPTAAGERLRLASPEFRVYVERVFRDQNRVADELAFALEAPGSNAELAAAEERLLAACAQVNELATARRDETELGIRASVRAARTVPGCEEATRAAEVELARVARRGGPSVRQ